MPCSTCTTGSPTLQLGEVADHRLDVRGALALLAAQPPRARRVQLGLGQDRELRAAQRESFMQRRDAECDPRRTREEIREIGAVAKRDADIGEHLRDRFAAARRIGDDQHAAVVVLGETRAGARSGLRPAARPRAAAAAHTVCRRVRQHARPARCGHGRCANARRTPRRRGTARPAAGSGASRSRARNRWRSLVSVQKRCIAPSIGPCSASRASGGK